MTETTQTVVNATPKTLPELRKFDGVLYVKNNSPYKQYNIRTRLGDQRFDVELAPAGQPDSIGILPKGALELRGFQRAWMRGTISVSTDEAMEDEITLLMNQHVKASDARLAEVMATTTPNNVSRELIEKLCLQCGRVNAQGVIEGGRVLMRAADVKNGVPPLCDDHVDMGHLFAPEQKTNAKGEVEWTFSPVKVQ